MSKYRVATEPSIPLKSPKCPKNLFFHLKHPQKNSNIPKIHFLCVWKTLNWVVLGCFRGSCFLLFVQGCYRKKIVLNLSLWLCLKNVWNFHSSGPKVMSSVLTNQMMLLLGENKHYGQSFFNIFIWNYLKRHLLCFPLSVVLLQIDQLLSNIFFLLF